jgi:signal transduction histidine kinase
MRVLIRDHGVRMELGQTPTDDGFRGGLGLFAMRERLGLLGGKVMINGVPGGGTTVVLAAPPGKGLGI